MKIIAALVVMGIAALGLYENGSVTHQTPVSEASPEPSPQAMVVNIEEDGVFFNIPYVVVDKESRVDLIPNYTEQKSSSEILNDDSCKYIANGGFYTKEGYPIGLFSVGASVLSKSTVHGLFNGYLFRNNSDLFISRTTPGSSDFALQSGPILLEGYNAVRLAIKNDKPARRVFAATTGDKIVFAAVHSAENYYSGPYLNDMPSIVKKAGEVIGMDFKDAINLDGGSASFFKGEGILLTPITYSGSYFCIN